MAWKDINSEKFKERAEISRQRRTGGSGDYWKPQVGGIGTPKRNVIRILPPHENMEDVFVEAKVHFSLGPNNDTAVGCLKVWGEECPACVSVDRMFKEVNAEKDPAVRAQLKEEARKKVAKLRFTANIVDMNSPEKGVQSYPFGPDVEKKLRATFYDDDGEFRNVTDPRKGRDIIISASKKPGGVPGKEFNQYDEVRAKENSSPLIDMDLLEHIKDLSYLAAKPKYEDVVNALKGIKPTGGGSGGQVVAAPAAAAASSAKPGAVLQPPATTASKKSASALAEEAVTRQPVREPVRELAENLPYAQALIRCGEVGFSTPHKITPKQTEAERKPPCYTKMADPKEKQCQGCRLLLPCLTALHQLVA